MSVHLEPGAILCGRYRVEERLVTTGTGTLYRVTQLATERVRALKVLSPALTSSHEARLRFEREARIAGRIESDYVVDAIDAGVDSDTGTPFIAMEMLNGQDLAQRLAEGGRFDHAEALELLSQLALGLEQTHRVGVVHRDLKPANVFLCERAGTAHVKILDFGIAKLAYETQHTDAILGTPLYMAPEQIRFKQGAISNATDVYGLAHIAYAMLVGEPYWQPESDDADSVMQLLMEIGFGATQAPSERAAERKGVELPSAFDDWFVAATAVDDRVSSAAVAVLQLARALSLPLPQPFADALKELSTADATDSLEPATGDAGQRTVTARRHLGWLVAAPLAVATAAALLMLVYPTAPAGPTEAAAPVGGETRVDPPEQTHVPSDEPTADIATTSSASGADAPATAAVSSRPRRRPRAARKPIVPALPSASAVAAGGGAQGWTPPITER